MSAPVASRRFGDAVGRVTALPRRARVLWGVVALVAGLDVATTALAPGAESNPVGVVLLAVGGVLALATMKIVLVAALAMLRSRVPACPAGLVPAIVAAIWGVAVVSNVVFLASTSF